MDSVNAVLAINKAESASGGTSGHSAVITSGSVALDRGVEARIGKSACKY